jgi:hypothetical protein
LTALQITPWLLSAIVIAATIFGLYWINRSTVKFDQDDDQDEDSGFLVGDFPGGGPEWGKVPLHTQQALLDAVKPSPLIERLLNPPPEGSKGTVTFRRYNPFPDSHFAKPAPTPPLEPLSAYIDRIKRYDNGIDYEPTVPGIEAVELSPMERLLAEDEIDRAMLANNPAFLVNPELLGEMDLGDALKRGPWVRAPHSEPTITRLIGTVEEEAARLIALAEGMGKVVTISLLPVEPLEMGNYRMIPEVRDARVAA